MERNDHYEISPAVWKQIQGLILSQIALTLALIDKKTVTAKDISVSLEKYLNLIENSRPEKADYLEPIKTFRDAIDILAQDEESDIFSSTWFADFSGNA